MTCLQSTSTNQRLHVHCDTLLKRERAADARCREIEAQCAAALKSHGVIAPELARRNRQADAAWGKAWDAWAVGRDALLAAPIETLADMGAKLVIIRQLAQSGGDVTCELEQLGEQFAAFAERRLAA